LTTIFLRTAEDGFTGLGADLGVRGCLVCMVGLGSYSIQGEYYIVLPPDTLLFNFPRSRPLPYHTHYT